MNPMGYGIKNNQQSIKRSALKGTLSGGTEILRNTDSTAELVWWLVQAAGVRMLFCQQRVTRLS